MKNMILKFIRWLTKPFNFIHYKLTFNNFDVAHNNLVAILSWCAAGFVIIKCFPYDRLLDFIFAGIGACAFAYFCEKTTAYVLWIVIKILTAIFSPPAMLYNWCDDKINHVARTPNEKSVWRGLKAEVGLRYFIEREKGIQINHAEYLGPD